MAFSCCQVEEVYKHKACPITSWVEGSKSYSLIKTEVGVLALISKKK
jgi:hypothetical protein